MAAHSPPFEDGGYAIVPKTGIGYKCQLPCWLRLRGITVVMGASSDPEIKTDELTKRLNMLSQDFGLTLAARVAEVRRIWSLVSDTPSVREASEALIRIHDIVHSLAGSGKTFGFPAVSKAATPLDGLFRLLSEQKHPLTLEEIAQIEVLIKALEESTCSPREEIDFTTMPLPANSDESADITVVVIVSLLADSEAESLRNILADFGYPAYIVSAAVDVPRAIVEGAPAIVYADISAGDSHLGLIRKIMALSHLPLVLASSRSGFHDRLHAVRCGATRFLAKPFEPEELIETLAALETTRFERPYRVAIVEDEAGLASFYQLVLEHAGMETRVVHQPSKLLDIMSGFDTDLILMDLYMPECNGLELAQIVRQFQAHTTVPILFLSTEARLDLQLRARHLGADDFLQKPLQPGQLVSAVVSRANRYRDLKKLTDRDSLTGLLNHANIILNLEREMSVATRSKLPVAFAMVDIDHFKSVNDTYGHVTGDQVILRVTHLIRNRLRRVDHVGRWGGEEFAVVMPSTDGTTAVAVMNQLREAASEIEHKSDQGIFRVTFSCGVATFPDFPGTPELTHAADDALYKAKRAGRNRVVLAGTP